MTQTATSQNFSSAELFGMGASAPAADGFSYMPVGGQVNDGKVTLELTHTAKLALAAKAEATQNKLKNTTTPTGKFAMPRRATQLQERGYNRYAALSAAHSPKPSQALKAQPVAAPAPKAQPKPAILALPLTKTMNVGQMSVNPTQQKRNDLHLVASNEVSKPTAAKPTQPSYASRAKYWGRSTGLVCAM
jgi:hypothetical protein